MNAYEGASALEMDRRHTRTHADCPSFRLPEGRRVESPMPDLNRRARQILPNIVVVEAVLPEAPTGDDDSARPTASTVAPVDQFRTFYQREHQREPRVETVTMFSDLYAEASQD